MNGMEPENDLNRFPVIQTENIPQVFDVSFQKGTYQCPCPFTGCPVSLQTWNGLRNHFNQHHWGESLRILEEHPTLFPKCEKGGSQIPPCRLGNRHYESDKFWIGDGQYIRQLTLQHRFKSSQVSISMKSEPLGPAASFPYLVRTVAYNNSDWVVVRRRWGVMGTVVTKTGATVQERGVIYKAILQ